MADEELSEVDGYGWGTCWLFSWVVGCAIGLSFDMAIVGMGGCIFVLSLLLLFWRKLLVLRYCGLMLATILVTGAWSGVRGSMGAGSCVDRFAGADASLVMMEGVVGSRIEGIVEPRGAFKDFGYRKTGSWFYLDVTGISKGKGLIESWGRVRVRIGEAEHRVKVGSKIRVTGWLKGFARVKNPGEFDYGEYAKRQGIYGVISLANGGNWEMIEEASGWGYFSQKRDAASLFVREKFMLGLNDKEGRGEVGALMAGLVLGERRGDYYDIEEGFRGVGLAHLLSISGAHVGILILFLCFVGRVFGFGYRGGFIFAMIMLGAYLLVVPGRVAVIRAGLMGFVWMGALISGRRVRAIDAVLGVGVLMLMWRPEMLVEAGFQLSFGIVICLILFTGKVSRWLWGWELGDRFNEGKGRWWVKWLVDFLAGNLVAFVVSVPLVGFHFGEYHGYSAVFMLMSMLLFTVVLCLGYLKLMFGIVLPSVGYWFAIVVDLFGGWFIGLVIWFGEWEWASGRLTAGVVVAIGCMLLVLLLIRKWVSGRDRKSRLGMGVAVMGLAVIVLPLGGMIDGIKYGRDEKMMGEMVSFAVGDGSCYVFRSGDEVMMFDCGAQGFLSVGERVVLPGLREMGVMRIDRLVISHADFDHYVGVLDVADEIEIGEVLVSEAFLRTVKKREGSAVAKLMDELNKRGIRVRVIGRGDELKFGEGKIEVLWPSPDFVSDETNEQSIVMRVEMGKQRVLMNGDIEDVVKGKLMQEDVEADICELPHHGSYVFNSEAFIDRVGASIVLQSSGGGRLEKDKWAGYFGGNKGKRKRYVTDRDGAVRVVFMRDGEMAVKGFAEGW